MKDQTDINETLLLTYFSGSTSSAEKEVIEAWLDQSEENRKLARDIEYLFFATNVLNTIRQIDAPATLKTVKKKINRQQKHSFWAWAQRVAAILFMPLLIISAYQYLKNDAVEYIEITTNPGMITAVDLPDGSKVWLNSESTLRRPLKFAKGIREVSLSGEAYFQIAEDEHKKFVVSTDNNLKVEVLGTKFNIEAYPGDHYIATTLEEGSVRLRYETGSKKPASIIMQPNQKVIFSKSTGDIQKLETYVSGNIAWKDRKIILRNTPLEEALKKLEHRFNVEFILQNEAIKRYAFTGTFDTQQLVQILEHFKISTDIKYRIIEPGPNDVSIQAKTQVILY